MRAGHRRQTLRGQFPIWHIGPSHRNDVYDGLPPMSGFNTQTMTEAQLAEFKKWYAKEDARRKRVGDKWLYSVELQNYCVDDVLCLIRGMMTFRYSKFYEESNPGNKAYEG